MFAELPLISGNTVFICINLFCAMIIQSIDRKIGNTNTTRSTPILIIKNEGMHSKTHLDLRSSLLYVHIIQ